MVLFNFIHKASSSIHLCVFITYGVLLLFYILGIGLKNCIFCIGLSFL